MFGNISHSNEKTKEAGYKIIAQYCPFNPHSPLTLQKRVDISNSPDIHLTIQCRAGA